MAKVPDVYASAAQYYRAKVLSIRSCLNGLDAADSAGVRIVEDRQAIRGDLRAVLDDTVRVLDTAIEHSGLELYQKSLCRMYYVYGAPMNAVADAAGLTPSRAQYLTIGEEKAARHIDDALRKLVDPAEWAALPIRENQ